MSAIFDAILQDRKIAYLVTNPEFTITACGGAIGLAHFAVTDDLMGAPLVEIMPELVGCEDILLDILTGKLPRFELVWVNRETSAGQTKYLNLTTLPHTTESGQITGLLQVVQEVTDMGELNQLLAQHRNELRLLQIEMARKNQSLEAANAELARLSGLKSIFISIAAHEIRSPLTTILGYTEMLLSESFGALQDNQHGPLELIQRSANRLNSITNNLLVAAKIEAGQIDTNFQAVEINGLVENIAAELRPLADAKQQTIRVENAPTLPLALCDPDLAAQIVTNLVNNALKYTSRGGLVTILVGRDSTKKFVQVSVVDNGVGIPLEDQPHLFERFSRASNVKQTGVRGSGLGLYIVHSLVSLHQGRVWFESEPGQGSAFYVTFPVANRPPLPSASLLT